MKTIFLGRYLSGEGLRREIHEGVNVVETGNRGTRFLLYGKRGEIAPNRLDDPEIAVFARHWLHACRVSITTLMVHQVFAEPRGLDKMTGDDFRALAPRLHPHVTPSGTFALDMSPRIPIAQLGPISMP
jgi:TnpA family transposase